MPERGRNGRIPSGIIIPALIAGALTLVLSVLVAGGFWLRPTAGTFDPVRAHEEWRNEVRTMTDGLDERSPADDVRRARERLLLLRVAAEDRDAHLRIILALVALERGEEGALRRLRETVAAAVGS